MVLLLILPTVNKKEIYEELFAQFVFALSGISVAGLNPVQVLSLYLALIREHVGVLRDRVMELSFSSVSEEIWFFKVLKPKFISEQIFRFEVYALEMGRPVGPVEVVRRFLEEELGLVRRFFSQYAFLYQYFRLGAQELDHVYFVRGATVPVGMVVEPVDSDGVFSTAMDYMFAKFMAFERLQGYLLELLNGGFPFLEGGAGGIGGKRRVLRWTGDSINAVELGFALHDTGQLNDGKASLTEIFEWMAEALNIVIKKPHRRFDEIEGRKIISKTDFLDKMRFAILNRIDRKLSLIHI